MVWHYGPTSTGGEFSLDFHRGSSIGGHGGRFGSGSDDSDKLKCEHCGRSCHTKDTCWDLLGHPPDSQAQTRTFHEGCGGIHFGNNRSSAHFVTIAQSVEPPIIGSSTPTM